MEVEIKGALQGTIELHLNAHDGALVMVQECTKRFNKKVKLRCHSMLHLRAHLKFHFREHLKIHKM